MGKLNSTLFENQALLSQPPRNWKRDGAKLILSIQKGRQGLVTICTNVFILRDMYLKIKHILLDTIRNSHSNPREKEKEKEKAICLGVLVRLITLGVYFLFGWDISVWLLSCLKCNREELVARVGGQRWRECQDNGREGESKCGRHSVAGWNASH